MRRRAFIRYMGLGLPVFHKKAFSKEEIKFIFGSEIIPEERIEKREYNRTVPRVVVWHTGQDGSTVRTVGFVEAASDEKKLLFISGFLLRKEIYPDLTDGFFLYFKTSLSYLSLPRRLRGQTSQTQERYAFNQQFTATSDDGFKAGLVKVDYKQMRLIEDGKVYRPDGVVLEATDPETSNIIQSIENPIEYPAKDMKYFSLWVTEVLYFKMDHIPLNFKLELPPLVINGFNVPFPLCYFEPYNILTKQWG